MMNVIYQITKIDMIQVHTGYIVKILFNKHSINYFT